MSLIRERQIFLENEIGDLLKRYNKALGEGGNAGDIISNPSMENVIEMISLENKQTDSVFNIVSDSNEIVSEDSKEYEVIMKRRNSKIFNWMVMWMVMVSLAIILAILQIILALTAKK